jgi:hypothetical protein
MNNLLPNEKLTLKEEMRVNFIPALERMIDKEKSHYEYLSLFEKSDYPMIEFFMARSEAFLKHLNERLVEYIQYYQTLK